jgi:hypothetical protein
LEVGKRISAKCIVIGILIELTTEASNWGHLLGRIVEVTRFLNERSLASFGSNGNIGNPQNGNFLEIIELFSTYDTVLCDRMKRFRGSQKNHNLLQTHCLCSHIKNKFIKLYE